MLFLYLVPDHVYCLFIMMKLYENKKVRVLSDLLRFDLRQSLLLNLNQLL